MSTIFLQLLSAHSDKIVYVQRLIEINLREMKYLSINVRRPQKEVGALENVVEICIAVYTSGCSTVVAG